MRLNVGVVRGSEEEERKNNKPKREVPPPEGVYNITLNLFHLKIYKFLINFNYI